MYHLHFRMSSQSARGHIWFVFLRSRREPSTQYGNEVLIYLLKDH